ncbi:hypothetical protein TGCAST_387520 [Toxoplasma gondii CAST]|uniref:Uncharacterized protein n=1 Tax=Toxoplasma gondii CAST TaxID=943122 RepID=A0A425I5B3_TOXGO|nr:hypothetical protein TGCAST_387520 [Toxoplasma gondii CAST]
MYTYRTFLEYPEVEPGQWRDFQERYFRYLQWEAAKAKHYIPYLVSPEVADFFLSEVACTAVGREDKLSTVVSERSDAYIERQCAPETLSRSSRKDSKLSKTETAETQSAASPVLSAVDRSESSFRLERSGPRVSGSPSSAADHSSEVS